MKLEPGLILFIIVPFANLFLWVRTARDGLAQVGTFVHAHAPQRWCSRAFLRTTLRQTVGESNLRVVYNLFRFLFFQNISIYTYVQVHRTVHERFTNGSVHVFLLKTDKTAIFTVFSFTRTAVLDLLLRMPERSWRIFRSNWAYQQPRLGLLSAPFREANGRCWIPVS